MTTTGFSRTLLLAELPAFLLGMVAGLIGYWCGSGYVAPTDARVIGFLSFSGAILGACLARLVWAADLRHAKKIDEIRSSTECHLRGTIASQKRQLAAALKGMG